MMKKLKEIKAKVFELLTNKPHLRDSDNKLIATIWYHQCGGKEQIHKFSGIEILENISQGKLSSVESIMRCRRKIQEQNIELRGKTYKERKKKATEVKQNIHSL